MLNSLILLGLLATKAFGGSPPGPPATAPGNGGRCSEEGKEFSSVNFWYKCEKDPNSKENVAKVMGCVYREDPGLTTTTTDASSSTSPSNLPHPPGTRTTEKIAPNGATFHLQETVMQCHHDEPTDMWTQTAIGCLSGPGGASERAVGEEWDEGDGKSGDSRIKYRMKCDKVGQFKVTKKAIQCVYNSNDGASGTIEGGCMKKFGDTLVQCVKREGKGQFLRAQVVIAPDQKVEQDAGQTGLKFC